MSKFEKGQTCRVTKNLLSPQCTGQEVTVLGVAAEKDGKVMYEIDEDGMHGYASESCLEAIDNDCHCGECCWFIGEDHYGYGMCPFRFAETPRCDDQCQLPAEFVSRKAMRHYLAVLLQANMYRRGQHVPAWHAMPHATDLGKAIDFAYKYIKTLSAL